MTTGTLGYSAEDAEVLIVAWQSALRNTSNSYEPSRGHTLPFTKVVQVGGTEDVDNGTADPIVQVDTLCDRDLGWGPAKDEAALTHLRMLDLARNLEPITLTDGRVVSIEYVNVFKVPTWEHYDNTRILQKSGRYTIGLLYVPSP